MGVWLISDFREVSKQILEMFFPHLYSIFLAVSFYFCSQGTLSSAQFIYCLPCYLWLPIFYQVSYFIDLALNVFLFFFLVCVSSLWAFLRFCILAFVGFLILSRNAIFMLSYFSSLLVTPMELYTWLLVWLVCTLELLPSRYWQHFHILHSE